MKYKNYIWDFGGTLFDTYPAFSKKVVEILRDKKIEEDYETILKMAKKSKSHLIDYLNEKYTLSDRELKYIRKCEKYTSLNSRSPFEGIEEILNYIISNGGKNFIYTHRTFHSAMELLYHYKMFDYFEDIVSKDVGLERKPDSEGFEYIIDKYDLEKNKTLSIGDRVIDVESSKGAGLQTAFFGEGVVSADIVFQDFSDFMKLINEGDYND
ncbi:HAD-IA family hydrolase [Geotoga petraea]|uniref:Haloacid dehalogenase superfamily, subfamily IA, variant 1 with third motif having Dx(3-4)D or Dx(3-4)E n=1 Tax=Geotoga petraea TaxID=28234 RepID=A0A1G6KNG2_9BACT|nr:HAD-IA family hydrolase [Geotoga petraea]SDC32055.1 haloacid dehalogenase superfamily, subfamily IA, variant 1 with third motif having Dx(3-4)D or Dx(3-4)E [Geotoga petraea]